MSDSRERLSTLAHLWNQCETPDRHLIFGQFLSLIAGAGTQHTGVKPEDFTEEMMVSLPMDNYEDLKPVDTWMAFFRGLTREDKVQGFKRMWDSTADKEKNVIVNDLRHFFLEPLINGGSSQEDDDGDDSDEEGEGAKAVAAAAAGLEEEAAAPTSEGLSASAPGATGGSGKSDPPTTEGAAGS